MFSSCQLQHSELTTKGFMPTKPPNAALKIFATNEKQLLHIKDTIKQELCIP